MQSEDRAALAALVVLLPARRRWRIVVPLTLAALAFPPGSRAAPAAPIELREALARARVQSPGIMASRARVAEARGELAGAGVLFVENPELEVAAGPRMAEGTGSSARLGFDLSLSQRVEIGGQRGHRMARASAELAAAEADVSSAVRSLDLAVATAYFQAQGARERARIAGEHERLAVALLEISKTRDERGGASPVELNAARIRAAESGRQLLRANAEEEAARVQLATALGLPPSAPFSLVGGLPEVSTTPPVAGPGAEPRPELAAAGRRREAAAAAAELAQAAAWPDLRVGARYTAEESSPALLGTLSIPIPVFQRNQGERERAIGAAQRLGAEEQALRARLAAEAEEARVERERAARALRVFDVDVLRAMDSNLALVERALAAGKLSPAEAIVLQRELLEGRIGYVDARVELAIADARQRTAAGLPILAEPAGVAR